jgi:hypothetical protein
MRFCRLVDRLREDDERRFNGAQLVVTGVKNAMRIIMRDCQAVYCSGILPAVIRHLCGSVT